MASVSECSLSLSLRVFIADHRETVCINRLFVKLLSSSQTEYSSNLFPLNDRSRRVRHRTTDTGRQQKRLTDGRTNRWTAWMDGWKRGRKCAVSGSFFPTLVRRRRERIESRRDLLLRTLVVVVVVVVWSSTVNQSAAAAAGDVLRPAAETRRDAAGCHGNVNGASRARRSNGIELMNESIIVANFIP